VKWITRNVWLVSYDWITQDGQESVYSTAECLDFTTRDLHPSTMTLAKLTLPSHIWNQINKGAAKIAHVVYILDYDGSERTLPNPCERCVYHSAGTETCTFQPSPSDVMALVSVPRVGLACFKGKDDD